MAVVEAALSRLGFLAGGGDMGALIRTYDWSTTPLGLPETWPQSLRSALSICLHSRFPTAIYWGPELCLLYNDAWAPIPAERHPWALGRPAAEVWADIWSVVGPQFEGLLANGEGFSAFDQMLPMVRGGEVKETFWNYSFTPIRGEDGSVAGVFNQGHETTSRVLAERQKAAETERLRRMFDQAPGFMAMLRGPEHVFELANAAYMQLVGHRNVVGKPAREALPEVKGQGFFELLDNVFATGQPFVGRAMPVDLQRTPGGAVERRFVDLVYQAVTDATGAVSGILAEGSDVTERVIAEAELRASEARHRALFAAAERRAAELRAVLESMPDAVYIGGVEGIILANQPALDQLGFVTREELNRHVGTLAEEIQTRDAETGVSISVEDQAFTRALGGERVVQDVRVRHRLSGEERVVRCAAAPVVIDGEVIAAVAVNTDVTEARRAEEKLRESEARQRFHIELGDALRPRVRPAEIQAEARRLLGNHLDTSRVHYAEIEPDGEHAVVPEDHARTAANQARRYRLADFARLTAECRAGRSFVATDLAADPRLSEAEKAMYASLSVAAMVVVPLVNDGRLVALLAVHREAPHAWAAGEIALVEETAERTWAAIERAGAEAALRESEERFKFLDSLGEATARAFAPREIMAVTAGLLGAHLRVTRCAYADVDANNDHFTIRDDWTDGAPSSAGEYSLDLFGSRAAADMRAGRTLVVREVDEELPAEDGGGTFSAIGIKAIVCCPLVKQGRLVAMMAVHQSSPRDWAKSEITLVETVVERAWAHIERVRDEAALRESEERFRLMADAVPQIVWITDADGRNEFYNEQWFAYTGAPREPVTAAETAVRYVHRDDAALTMERFEEARRTGSTFLVEHRIRSKEGEYRWFLVRGEPQRDPRTGEIRRWFGASVDIDDRRQAEAALREREERLRLIVEGARDYAIFTTDPEGRIDAWLPGAASVFGWSPEEIVGQPVAITFAPEDRARGAHEEELEIARREGAAPNVRWHLRKDGARVFIEGSVTALRRPDGGVRGFLKIGQDVTRRRAAEEAQALLAREVDHRAKNALTVVQTMLRLTRADDVSSFARAVEGRVASLARAQTLLAEERWNGAALHSMLQGELAPFLAGQRADLDGPPVVLPPGTAQPLAMAVHELATNAAKHGALSVPEGRVSVSWRVDCGATGLLHLRWAEAGGPAVAGPPTRRGFGSRVLEGTVRRQLGGEVSLTWATTGLVCTMEVPLRHSPPTDGAAAAGRVTVGG